VIEGGDMHRRSRIQAALGVALIAVAGAGFVGSASWAGTPLRGRAPTRSLDAGLARVSPAQVSQPVPTPSMQDMMQSMQEMMNRCSQMMAAGGMVGTNQVQPVGMTDGR